MQLAPCARLTEVLIGDHHRKFHHVSQDLLPSTFACRVDADFDCGAAQEQGRAEHAHACAVAIRSVRGANCGQHAGSTHAFSLSLSPLLLSHLLFFRSAWGICGVESARRERCLRTMTDVSQCWCWLLFPQEQKKVIIIWYSGHFRQCFSMQCFSMLYTELTLVTTCGGNRAL